MLWGCVDLVVLVWGRWLWLLWWFGWLLDRLFLFGVLGCGYCGWGWKCFCFVGCYVCVGWVMGGVGFVWWFFKGMLGDLDCKVGCLCVGLVLWGVEGFVSVGGVFFCGVNYCD